MDSKRKARESTARNNWRESTQFLAPVRKEPPPPGAPDVYPTFPPHSGQIEIGFEALARRLAAESRIVIDGYVGVFWKRFRQQLEISFRRLGVQSRWLDVRKALKPEAEIERLVAPFLGGDDPLFGTRFNRELSEFFDLEKLAGLKPDGAEGISILYGCGAALADWPNASLVYLDIPKNEIQFRARAGSIFNLGRTQLADPKSMYQRFYFVDWIALNQHKKRLLKRIDWIVDAQRPKTPTFMRGNDLRRGLTEMSRNWFRTRPWFEPGPWGGQWIKQRMPQLNRDAPNLAWSFELIVPENGLTFESNGRCLECSFDFLMYQDAPAVLGEAHSMFGDEFPIRFDFLDTFSGGNLSLQCHPKPAYINRHFGESFTQDETYYILDCRPDARVFLGFNEDIDPDEFRNELERSLNEGVEIDIPRYVNSEPARKHVLFLIPNGTIHSSGRDNMVLEISATPYIYTFKMYDWLRLDLDGRPRPLNIDRAFENLHFERRGKNNVQRELVSRQYVRRRGDGWRIVHCPTHPKHFYDVYRYEFDRDIEIETRDACHVMMLVEGEALRLETHHGRRQDFHYAETFVVPAAAERYRLVNLGRSRARVVQAFVKPGLPKEVLRG